MLIKLYSLGLLNYGHWITPFGFLDVFLFNQKQKRDNYFSIKQYLILHARTIMNVSACLIYILPIGDIQYGCPQ